LYLYLYIGDNVSFKFGGGKNIFQGITYAKELTYAS
jgi:hypothetical protein